ncbi:MAG TPA: DUF3365 domain-containing protein [Pirellulales bacterium]|jgi:hypothetical protein|nr:DUF3365 domain-containing protein [Pirellulales bacterium]
MRKSLWAACLTLTAIVGATIGTMTLATLSAADPTEERAVERARREVKLLDDIYKTAIVLITKHYVEESSDLPAGEAFKVLFENMKSKGWHEVRLLDGLGEPLNDENKPQDDFERTAIKQVLAGKEYYEKIDTMDGKRYLRAATVLPMVMDKCVMCHDNFKGKKVVGALAYTLPLETNPPAKPAAEQKSK